MFRRVGLGAALSVVALVPVSTAAAAPCSGSVARGPTVGVVYVDPNPSVAGKTSTASLEWDGSNGDPVSGSIHFSAVGPSGPVDVQSSGGPSATFTAADPGSYTVTATWQVQCRDGSADTASSQRQVDVVKPRPARFMFTDRAGAAISPECVQRTQDDVFADEPATVSIYWTTNGKLPTTSSPHLSAVSPHGCAADPVSSRTDGTFKRGPLQVTRSDGEVAALPLGVHVRARFLLVGKSGSKTIAAARLKVVPKVTGHDGRTGAPIYSEKFSFDSGPCPVACTHKLGAGVG